MVSKSRFVARTAALLLLVCSCRSSMPWRNEPIGDEVNLSFTLENNLLFLTTARIDGREGRFFFGSSHVRSVIDPRVGTTARGQHVLTLSEKDNIAFSPVVLDLGNAGDAIVGADVWGKSAVTIDYRSGLVTMNKQGIVPALMTVFKFEGEPTVMVNVNGQPVAAIVDTASPDTLVLPATAQSRGKVNVEVAGAAFNAIDVRYDDVPRARIGNRLLSRFLVTIDYGKKVVGLWRDPRIPG
jgi:hypothetical protein